MAIYNKRLIMRIDRKDEKPLLDRVRLFLKKSLKPKEYPLRYAIVSVRGNTMAIEVTVIEV